MRSEIARFLHSLTNATYWLWHPSWDTGNRLLNVLRWPFRVAPFSLYDPLKAVLYKRDVLAVAGESVVQSDTAFVRKHLLRRPRRLSVGEYAERVEHEVTTLTDVLGLLALKTSVYVGVADVFRMTWLRSVTVYLEQERLDMSRYSPFLGTPDDLRSERTRRDLRLLLQRVETLASEHGYYPDLGPSSGNLLRDSNGGRLLLIDVMPLYADGSRLLGDTPSKLPHTLSEIERFTRLRE